MKTKSLFFAVAFFLILDFTFLSCTPKATEVEHKRDISFFKTFINNSNTYSGASQKIAELKLLATGEEYPIRVALFDNSLFYYQVDKLGDGEGRWEFKNGALYLLAPRQLFDMEFLISAARDEGDETLLEFYDRYGHNTLSTQFRDPARSTSSANSNAGIKNESLPPLRVFSFSNKGI